MEVWRGLTHSLSDLDAYNEMQCLYLYKVKECEYLAEKLSKQIENVNEKVYNGLSRSFAKLEKHSISLELDLQHCKEKLKNDTVCKDNASNVFRKEREQYHEIQYLKAQLQDKNTAISELKKLVERSKGKSVETQFDRPFVVRQPNAQRIPKPPVSGKPTPFSNSPVIRTFSKKESVDKTNVSDGSSIPVTAQILPSTANKAVVQNNSQVKFKKTEAEDHRRISSISNKTKSVTACNDSLNSRTMNVNDVCADCGKCVFNLNHDACVSKYLNDVNARTKKPKVVPISTRKPKNKANEFVATPHKKIVAPDTTIQKSKSYFRELYENTYKEWKWWIEKQSSLGYKWTPKPPKTKKIWMPKNRTENVSTSISPTIDNIVQLVLFIVESECTKHMTGNLKLLCNFVEKFLVEGLNHNLFSVGQFCDADLEVAFWKSTCYSTSVTPLYLIAKASLTQSWLWHRRLSHLNFDYINLLSKKDIMIGLPKLKYVKDQLCSSCEVSKAKRSSFKLKAVPSSKGRLNLLHMDLCCSMRVASINGKKYILVIVDDYSQYT
ncbi:retrovirus-related pol polyprotein from transposon TNT 1-94 [Tanacetum coccineum]